MCLDSGISTISMYIRNYLADQPSIPKAHFLFKNKIPSKCCGVVFILFSVRTFLVMLLSKYSDFE